MTGTTLHAFDYVPRPVLHYLSLQQPIAARSATESFQYFGRGAPPLFNGSGQTQKIIPAVLNGFE